MFRSEDLPTFERPIKANSGSDSSGQELESAALQKNVADEIFTLINARLIVAQIERAETYIVRKTPVKARSLELIRLPLPGTADLLVAGAPPREIDQMASAFEHEPETGPELMPNNPVKKAQKSDLQPMLDGQFANRICRQAASSAEGPSWVLARGSRLAMGFYEDTAN
jgi:hypothetical protein